MLIISNKIFARHSVRRGTEKDVQKLYSTFQKRGYTLHVYTNLTAQVSDALPTKILFIHVNSIENLMTRC